MYLNIDSCLKNSCNILIDVQIDCTLTCNKFNKSFLSMDSHFGNFIMGIVFYALFSFDFFDDENREQKKSE